MMKNDEDEIYRKKYYWSNPLGNFADITFFEWFLKKPSTDLTEEIKMISPTTTTTAVT